MISNYSLDDKDGSDHSQKTATRHSVIQRKRSFYGDNSRDQQRQSGTNQMSNDQKVWLSQLKVKHRSLANKLENQKRQLTTIHNQLIYFDLSKSDWIQQIPSLKVRQPLISKLDKIRNQVLPYILNDESILIYIEI